MSDIGGTRRIRKTLAGHLLRLAGLALLSVGFVAIAYAAMVGISACMDPLQGCEPTARFMEVLDDIEW